MCIRDRGNDTGVYTGDVRRPIRRQNSARNRVLGRVPIATKDRSKSEEIHKEKSRWWVDSSKKSGSLTNDEQDEVVEGI